MVKDMAAVVAVAANSRGIGYKGELPWKLPGDMKHFKQITMQPPTEGATNVVIMGRNTWESIPEKFRPLPGRTNVVLTRNADAVSGSPDDVIVANSLDDACSKLDKLPDVGDIFVIGGSQVYDAAMKNGYCKKIIYTKVWNLPEDQKFDAFFPELDTNKEWDEKSFSPNDVNIDKENSPAENGNEYETDKKSGVRYQFLEYTKKKEASHAEVGEEGVTEGELVNEEEMQYLNLCSEILKSGISRGDRTGTGTISMFGPQMKFSLRDNTIPLLTTKRTFWRGVAEELLWFISGNTNANDLADKNIHIWDGNGSREFLDSRGLKDREVGDLGPVYGFQWRHFGAKYIDMHTDYTGQGVDQLAECIDKIINNPEDRRIIMSAWNPAALSEMALPPCHMFCQFYVDTDKNEVSCLMYQRSADMGLGVPFNIASYALLTHLIAHVTGRKPGDFIHTIGDAHIYSNHVDAIKEQLLRKPREFPKLKINNNTTNIDDIKFDDLELIGYKPHKTIKMKMAV